MDLVKSILDRSEGSDESGVGREREVESAGPKMLRPMALVSMASDSAKARECSNVVMPVSGKGCLP